NLRSATLPTLAAVLGARSHGLIVIGGGSMRTTLSLPWLACGLLSAAPLCIAPLARAEVVGVEITSSVDVDNGAPLGDVGAYEVISGRIRFAVDPANPRNRVIAGLDALAAANARSRGGARDQRDISVQRDVTSRQAPSHDPSWVEFSAGFAILR